MYIGQSSAAWALLLHPGCPCWFSQHPALGNEHDVTFRELFLKLPRKPNNFKSPFSPLSNNGNRDFDSPELNFMEGLELRYGNENDDRLFTTANINLPGSRNLQGA